MCTYETSIWPAVMADAVPKIQDGGQRTESSNIRNYDIYRQSSNGEPTAFDHGKLAGSVPRRFQ